MPEFGGTFTPVPACSSFGSQIFVPVEMHTTYIQHTRILWNGVCLMQLGISFFIGIPNELVHFIVTKSNLIQYVISNHKNNMY